jgi:DNA-directed RNA polymerase specialized sigma24 family protein
MGRCLPNVWESGMIRGTPAMTMKSRPVDRSGSISSTGDLFDKARLGDDRALSALVRRNGRVLRKWARGRLPQWARSMSDTADIVQDVLLRTFLRIDRVENRGKGALQAYLRQAVVHRIQDEMRRVSRRPTSDAVDSAFEIPAGDPSPFDLVLDAEHERRSKRPTAEAARLAVRRAVLKVAASIGSG